MIVPFTRTILDDSLLDVGAGGGIICTATQRLSRYLREAWDAEMVRRGNRVWETPRILPLVTWQQELVREAAVVTVARGEEAARLLTSTQERICWERASREALAEQHVQHELLARQLMEAHQLQQAWGIRDEELLQYATPGAEQYMRVLTVVRSLWSQLGVRPLTALSGYARQVAEQHPELLPSSAIMAGFDLIPDNSLRAFQDAMEKHGVPMKRWIPQRVQGEAVVHQYTTFEDEVDAAAVWCRELLEQGEKGIAVVLPSLDRVRDLVERRFSDILAPGQVLEGHDAESGLFELSLGKRCADEPMLSAALHAITLLLYEIPLEALSSLLRGPFIAATEKQRRMRIELDLILRETGSTVLTRSTLQRFIGNRAEDDVLLRVMADPENIPRLAMAETWSTRFAEMLRQLGWPGSRGLTSREYQGRRRIQQLIEEFATWSAVLPALSAGEAVSRFRALVQEQIFQPESAGAPVQILGVLETAGMRMHHCRIIGMNEERWPPPMRTNAFIPISLQRRAGITDVLPERYLQQMREVTTRLEDLAEKTVFTCSRKEADKDLLPSPLLRHLPHEDAQFSQSFYVEEIQQTYPASIERAKSGVAPPLQDVEDIRGGTRILSLQSACPFRAFAELRLHAQAPADPHRGVQLRERGSMMHHMLEQFWRKYESRQKILGMTEEEIRTELNDLLEQELRATRTANSEQLPAHIEQAERVCIVDILSEWLMSERDREDFTVRHVEREATIKIGSLEFGTVVDRIDAVGAGDHHLLIDYKSGIQGLGAWADERLGDPQLPLYAVTAAEEVSGLAFGILRRGECRLLGLTDDQKSIPGLQSALPWIQKQGIPAADWKELVAFWRKGLHALADEFVEGRVQVQPRDGEDTCRYCSLRHLCRIDSLRAEASDG